MGGNNNYSHRRAERDAHQRVWGEIQLIGGARQFKAPIGNTPEEAYTSGFQADGTV